MTNKVITITSGKGGVGKTTATANIATALAVDGARVVCIDADIGLRNLDVVLGLENRIVYDLVDVVEGRCRLRQAMIRDKRLPNLFLIPAAQTRDKTAVSPSDMVRLIDDLRNESDWVLIDSPAGIERGFRNAIAPADVIVVITNPEISAVRDADRIIGLIEAEEKGPARLVLNRLKPEMVKREDMLSPDDVIELLAEEFGFHAQQETTDGGELFSFEATEEDIEKFKELLDISNELLFGKDSHYELSVHKKTGTIMSKLVNTDTGEIMKEFPPEKILDMIAGLWEIAGIIIDEQA